MSRRRYAATGFLLGAGWGVLARGWMRLMSTDPSFSWAGTSELVVGAGVAGMLLALAERARRTGGRQWWRLVVLYVVFLFSGAGFPLLPAVVVGGWGLRRGVVGRLVALVALVSAPAILLAMTWEEVDQWLNPYPDTLFRAVIGGGAFLFSAAAAWGASSALGPWNRDRRPSTGLTTGPHGPDRTEEPRVPIG